MKCPLSQLKTLYVFCILRQRRRIQMVQRCLQFPDDFLLGVRVLMQSLPDEGYHVGKIQAERQLQLAQPLNGRPL